MADESTRRLDANVLGGHRDPVYVAGIIEPCASFSGIRASGDKTLGNYSGGFRQYVATQEQGDAFFCVVDLHSITTPFEPEVLHSDAVGRRLALRHRARPAALHGLRPEPRDRTPRSRLAAQRGGELELRA